jgi:hypothetical protein
VALATGPRSFSIDGVEHSLGGAFHRGPRTAVFDLGGQDASVTLWLVAPAFRSTYRRYLRKLVRRLPFILPAFVFGGAGGGGGMVAGSIDVRWSRAIYELHVNGVSQGSWVSRVTGDSGSWTFVEAGHPLPEADWLDWPTPRS